MSIFTMYAPKEKLLSKSYEIDLSLYEKLEKLSNEKYDASINKLLNTCLEYLISTRKVSLYERAKDEVTISRSFLIRKSLHDGMVSLKNNYNISFNKLVNIALYNALKEEGML